MTLDQLVQTLTTIKRRVGGDLLVIVGDDYDGWANLFTSDIGVIDNPFVPGQKVVAIGDLSYRTEENKR